MICNTNVYTLDCYELYIWNCTLIKYSKSARSRYGNCTKLNLHEVGTETLALHDSNDLTPRHLVTGLTRHTCPYTGRIGK